MPSDPPKPIWSGSFSLFGVEVKCHVLDTGQRIIEEGSLNALFEAMGDPDRTIDPTEMEAFSRWQKGI